MNANGWKDVNASGTPLSTQNTNVVFPAVYLESGTYAWAVRAMDEHIVYSTWVYGGNFTVSNLLNATLTATPSSGYDDEMDVPNVTLATTVTGTVTGTTTYQFDCFGDGTYDFTQTDNGVTTNCGYTTAGEYRPKVLVSRGGYTTTATTTITVIGRPRLSCSVTPQQGLSPLVVRVTLSPLYLPEGMSFDYDMNNDGVYEYKDRPSTVYYTYSTPGKYVIKVRASDGTFANTPCSPADINVTSPSSGNGGEVSP